MDGPTSGPALLLANSLGTTLDMWGPQGALWEGRRVLRYDMRGHGQSAVPAGAYSMDRLVHDVIDLLDDLHLERVDFCGLSLGGMVGQWLAVRAPERLDRLVLANTSAFMGPAAAWQQRIETVLRDGMAAVVDAVMERWFSPNFLQESPGAAAPVRRMLLETHPTGYAGCCSAIRDMDLRPIVPLIRAPTLVLGGEYDPATPPDHAHWLAEAIPGARLKVLPAAHLANWEAQSAFTAAVQDFLKPA